MKRSRHFNPHFPIMNILPIRGVMRVALLVLAGSAALFAQPPNVTTTKTDTYTPNGAGKVVPGGTIKYNTTITNGGTGAANNVELADAVPSGTTLVPNSVNVSPLAFDDSYQAIVNTQLAAGSPTVLSGPRSTSTAKVTDNDTEFLGDSFTISAYDATSANSGSVVMVTSGANMGSFTYLPAAGFVGTDSFTYTIRDDGTDNIAGNADDLNGSGTVTITVADANTPLAGTQRIWYIDNNYGGANGSSNGTSARPYTALSAVSAASGADVAGDTLYLSTGSGAYTGGITLLADQSLIGENQALVVNSTTLNGAGTDPLITNASGNGITLDTNNTLKGFTVGNTTTGDIVGTAVGTLTVANVNCNGTGPIMTVGTSGTLDVTLDTATTSSSSTTGVSLAGCTGSFTGGAGAISGVTGDDFVISGGTATVNFAGTITNNSARSVNISGKTGGTVTFSGALADSSGSTGISLTNNTGATINFTGGISSSTGANAAFTATGGGTVNVTGSGNTLATTTAVALNVTNTTIGSSGLTFVSISSNGGTGNGIILDTTGSLAGLTVTGDGSNTSAGGNSSGGTIQNKNGADGNNTQGIGIYLNNTRDVVLRRMSITGVNQNFGIRGFSVTNFTMQYCTVGSPTPTNSGSIASHLQGTSVSGIGEGAVYFGNQTDGTLGVTGTASIDNCFISGGRSDNMQVSNGGGTLSRLSITNCTFGYNFIGTPSANAALTVVGRRASVGNTVLNSTVTGCTFVGSPGNAANFTGQEPTLALGIAMDTIFQNNTITNNHPQNIISGCNITIAGFSSTTFNISNNSMSGADGSAITLQMGAPVGGSTVTTALSGTINNNQIGVNGVANSGSKSGNGIFLSLADNATAPKGLATITLTNNTILNYSGNAGIYADNTGGSYDLNFTCSGNTTAQPGPSAFAGLALTAGAPSSSDDVDVFANITGNNFSAGDQSNSNDMIVGVSTGSSSMKLAGTGGPASNTPFASLAAVQTFLVNNNNVAGTVATAYVDPPATTSNFLGAGATNPPLPSTLLFAEKPPESAPQAIPPTAEPPLGKTVQAAQRVQSPALTPQSAQQATSPAESLTQAALERLAAEAVARWEAAGITDEQKQRLKGLRFEISDLNTLHLGQASGDLIQVSRTAAGNSWFIDSTPSDDSEFAGTVEGVDLLTTLIHEMGHTLGLADDYDLHSRDSIMYGHLTRGERRLPAKGEATGLHPAADVTPRYLGATITIGTLPPGKSVTVVGTVTVDDPASSFLISSQGTVSGSNFTSVLTDDPAVGGAADPTLTPVERPDTTVTSLTRSATNPTNASSVTWQIVFADALTGLTGSNFSLANGSLGGSPAITDVSAVGGTPATTWTITASNGSGSGTLGLNMANDTSLNYDVTNLSYTGEVYTIDRTPPDASIRLSDSALKIGDTSTVTITFTESVTGFTTADISAPNGTLSSLSSSDGGITWRATLTPGTSVTDASNVVTVDKTGVQDAVGNAGIGNSTSSNYTVDTVRPTVSSIVVADDNLAIGETSLVTFTFSEAVAGFTKADLFVDNGSLSALSSSDGGITWTATLTPNSGVTAATNVITLDLTGVTDLAGNAGTGTATSNNYAMVGMTIAIAADAASAAEGSGGGTTAFNFTVSRLGSTTAAVTVNYAVSGAAVTSADFGGTLPSGTVTIPASQASTTLAIQVSKDSTVELDEAFTVTLSNPTDGVIATSSAGSTITNDDSSVVSLVGGSVNEGDSGTANLPFTVSLTNPVDVAISVDRKSLATGSATAGTDFTALADATLNIPANTTSATFNVSVTGDNDVESNETVDASISNLAANGRSVILGTVAASGTITDDDPLLVAATGSMSVKRGSSGKLKVSALLALTTPVESRPVSLVSVQNPSAANGTVTIVEGWIYYQPLAGYVGLDSFNYTITDGVQTVSGKVNVTIASETGATLNYQLTDEGAGKRLRSFGIPGRTYRMEVSSDLATWSPLGAPMVCPPSGLMSFLDPGPLPPTRFYQVVETAP